MTKRRWAPCAKAVRCATTMRGGCMKKQTVKITVTDAHGVCFQSLLADKRQQVACCRSARIVDNGLVLKGGRTWVLAEGAYGDESLAVRGPKATFTLARDCRYRGFVKRGGKSVTWTKKKMAKALKRTRSYRSNAAVTFKVKHGTIVEMAYCDFR